MAFAFLKLTLQWTKSSLKEIKNRKVKSNNSVWNEQNSQASIKFWNDLNRIGRKHLLAEKIELI